MEINRNQYFMVGLVVLLLGIQFRRVERYVLTPEASRFVAQKLKRVEQSPANSYLTTLVTSQPVSSTREVKPPKWLGWFMLSIGGVLMLHSLAMPRPG